jgi:drug/metabolite transporter (DMT)-like permease
LSVPLFRLRLDRATAVALGLTTTGCALVFSDAFSRHLDSGGLAQALLSMLAFSAYLLFAQHFLRRERPITLAFYVLVWVTATFCLANLPLRLPAWGPGQWLVALGLGVVPTTVAVSFLYRAIDAVGSARTSLFSSFEPITTVTLACLLLGEEVAPSQLAGAACIVAGIALPNLVALWSRGPQLREPPVDR